MILCAGSRGQAVDVELISPGSLYADQISQLDLSIAKAVEFGASKPAAPAA